MPPRSVLIAIGKAVQRAGGDITDADDLVGVWKRLEADQRGRVDRMRFDAANTRCSCADGGWDAVGGRCDRCFGRTAAELERIRQKFGGAS